MKINGKEMILTKLEIENIENEIVAYDKQRKRIISFNQSASFIWNILNEANEQNLDISSQYICEKIISTYAPQKTNISLLDDVNKILKEFCCEELIKEYV